MDKQSMINSDKISQYILFIRNHKIILDTDLARIYGVKTKRLNEQVKRNINRFPDDFMFNLTDKELEEVVANCDHLENLKYSSNKPRAFTEHGALMVSSIINSASAIETSIYIVRAFIRLREILSSQKDIQQKIIEMERKYDKNFSIVFGILAQLIEKESKPRKQIGFKTQNDDKSE